MFNEGDLVEYFNGGRGFADNWIGYEAVVLKTDVGGLKKTRIRWMKTPPMAMSSTTEVWPHNLQLVQALPEPVESWRL